MKTTRMLVVALLAVFLLGGTFTHAKAQTAASGASANSLVGNWQATVTAGQAPFRIGLVISKDATGNYAATLVNIEQGVNIPVQQITFVGDALHLDIPAAHGTYDGTLRAEGSEIAGNLTQGPMPTPLTFKRVDKLDPPPTFDQAAAAEVANLINTYFHSFTIKDWDTFRSCLETPWTTMGGDNTNVGTSLDDVVKNYQNIRNGLDGTEYAVSRAAEMKITPLSPTAAFVDVHWRRDKKDGSIFQQAAEILMVVKTNGAWKIHGNLARQLSEYGKAF